MPAGTNVSYIAYMSDSSRRIAKSIRIKESAYHQARIAAVTSKRSIGEWLEEAIEEKLERASDRSLIKHHVA